MGSNLLFKYGKLNWLHCSTVEGLNDPPRPKYQDLGIQIMGDNELTNYCINPVFALLVESL
ncbi:hypothetical protein NMY3_03419 [Candidatus Nitrosocosmicus oleophilus]|jgi:hypothetical protein|uniref:Uncharacterized protein n=1 Tax=Candidatus Nitrosocosmicus oleophilus TaxID=1353260 RepID=A0A654MDQ7_9ARCH|nr:hypothetical protein NMY3_03419 [Candidatus Nitrosocosmicus oleophilus]